MTHPLSKANRIVYLRNAHNFFSMLNVGNGVGENMNHPPAVLSYNALYEDMRDFSREWELFWGNIRNSVWNERAVGILLPRVTLISLLHLFFINNIQL